LSMILSVFVGADRDRKLIGAVCDL
jgi:hypothetical protein